MSKPARSAADPTMGPWNESLAILAEWDPVWADTINKMMADPWKSGILPPKFIELVCVALSAACTSLDVEATHRHIRNALSAGASRDEVLMVLKMSTVLAIHSFSLGAPILVEEVRARGLSFRKVDVATPACDMMRAAGQWNEAWDPFLELDPAWTDEVMAAGIAIYSSKVFSPRETELLSIALDASYTHMYAPGTRRHIKGALAAGATPEEVTEILKLCVTHGAQCFNLAVPILNEELARHAAATAMPAIR